MKKIYSTPAQKVVDLELESLIANSDEPALRNVRGNGAQLTKGEADMDDMWESDGESSGGWGPRW